MIRSFRLVATTLAVLLAAGCGAPGAGGGDGGAPGDGGADGGVPATNWHVASVVDLGSTCMNAGSVAITGHTAWVGCTGDYAPGHGRLAEVDLATGTVRLFPVAGAPGPVAIAGSGGAYTVYLGDLSDGRITATAVHGQTVATPSAPATPCPSNPSKKIYAFISGLVPAGSGTLLASCFATDEVVRIDASADAAQGKTVLTSSVRDRVTVGDGPGDLAPAAAGDYLVVDGLAGTASVVHAGAKLTADVDRYQTGNGPNAIRVDGDTAFVANSGGNTLLAFSRKTGKPMFETPTGDGTNPWSLALAGGQALVTLNLSDAVLVVDATTGKVDQRLALPTGGALHPFPGMTPLGKPQGIAATADGSKVAVAMTNLDKKYKPAGDGLLVILEPGT